MNIVQENWDNILNKMKTEYCPSNIAYNTWIAPLTIFEITKDMVYILVNQEASLEHIENKYLLPFKVSIAEVTGKEYDISFVTSDEEFIESKKQIAEETKKNSTLIEKANLNKRYTFETFVVGKNNNFAHAASFAVSKQPGEVYNPLFIYGGVGLGKTHLMHSIAHRIINMNPNKKVLYVTSEAFTNEMINALKTGKAGDELAMSSFRDKYRNNDVLLIDDIQFIIGKSGTQEEFFHTFNHMHNSGKQIIISSDRPPKDLETLDARLRTRFSWGLSADIQAPDYETRMAILKKKIELDFLESYNIPDEVIQYIASNIKSNIRELEGSLNKLIAFYNLEKKSIDIPLASEALKDFVTNTREITDTLILETVAEHFNISIADIIGKKRSANIVLPRHIVMYLCRHNTNTDSTLEGIGILLGGRDHGTVINGVKRIETLIETDEALNNTITIIRKKLNPI